MSTFRPGFILAGLLIAPTLAAAQNCNLTESPKAGECFKYEIETTLSGSMKVVQDGKENMIKLSAKNTHAHFERVINADKGVIRKAARYYEKAACTAEIADSKVNRGLRDDRRLIVAQRTGDQLLCYSPAGPLTRQELEVVAEHFDTLHLTGLLPGKEVAAGDSWKIPNATAQAVCLFEGLVKHDLTGKLLEVKNGVATVSIEGTANGIELGASVKLDITATLRFDPLRHRITEMEWKQKDVRDQGPASPATAVESTTMLKRSFLAEEPRELNKTVLASIPSEDQPQELLTLLVNKHPGGKYSFLQGREWHQVGATDTHLVLRLLDRGDFIAQATIVVWKKEEAGKHMDPEDFKKVLGMSPGWDMEEIVEAGEVPTDDSRWMYRVTAKGDLDGAKVVQNFILLAGPKGDQIVVTFTMKPANAAKIGTRDVSLVNSIEFQAK